MRKKSNEILCLNLWSDFTSQIEEALDVLGLKKTDLAEKVRVSKGRVSQIMNAPGNLTLSSMVRLSSAVGKKIEITLRD